MASEISKKNIVFSSTLPERFRSKKIFSYCIILGGTMIIMLGMILLINTIGFSCNVSLVKISLPCSLVFSFCLTLLFNHSGIDTRITMVLIFIIILLLLFTSIKLSTLTYDFSSDGLYYHQKSMVLLSEGWNPIVSPENDNFKIQKNSKGSYILGSSIYALTGIHGHGKAINWILFFAVFAFTFGVLANFSFLSSFLKVLLTLGLCLNPVWSSEASLFLVDGQLYLALLALVVSLVYMYQSRSRFSLWISFFTIILAFSFKLTALAYTSFFLFGFSFICLIYNRKIFSINNFVVFFSAVAISVFVVNYNPIVTNTLRDGNPITSKTEKFETWETINIFDRFKALFISSLMNPSPQHARNKNEFNKQYTIRELFNSWSQPFSDSIKYSLFVARKGGYTPLFGIAVILSIAVTIMGCFIDFRRTFMCIIVTMILFISSVLVYCSYWFRYTPQVWMLPFIVAIFGFSYHHFLASTLSKIILIVMLFISILFVQSNARHYLFLANVTNTKLEMLHDLKRPIAVFSENGKIKTKLFQEMGIDYYEVNTIVQCDVYITKQEYGGLLLKNEVNDTVPIW